MTKFAGSLAISLLVIFSRPGVVFAGMQRILLSALLIFVPGSWALADGVEIRQKYKPDFRYTQQVTITQESSISTGLTNSTTKTNTAFDLQSTVAPYQKDSAKGVSVAVRYTKVVMSVDKDGRKFQYDPEQASDPRGAGPLQMLAGLAGRGFNAILDESGSVQSVEESQPLVNLLSSNVSPTTVATYRELFGPTSIKGFLEQTTLRSPKGVSLKPGESWPLSQEFPLPGLGKLLISGSYKFVGMTEFEGTKCAEIAVSATIAQQIPALSRLDLQDNDRFDTLSKQMRLKVNDSTMVGVIFFDPAIAFPRALNLTQSLTIEAKIPDGTANLITIPMKQTISVRLAEMTDVVPQ